MPSACSPIPVGAHQSIRRFLIRWLAFPIGSMACAASEDYGGTTVAPPARSASTGAPTMPPGVNPDWWSGAQRRIREQEYRITRQEQGLQAPNRAHNMRTWFDESGGLSVSRADGSPGSGKWQWGLQLERIGWKNRELRPVAPATPMPEKNTVTYHRGDSLREWYVNDESGLKSWFRLETAPEGPAGDTLRLELSVRGNTRAFMGADGRTIGFRSSAGSLVVNYGGLKAWDAAGRELPARLGLEEAGGTALVVLEIAAVGAAYPLTIDPLATSPAWIAEGDQAGAQFGYSVATAGDVNGDGYSDVIVGASGYDNGAADEGRAFVYLGSASGLSPAPAWIAPGDQAGACFGNSVASAGDVNGDGYCDVIVGAYLYDSGETDEGRAYVYLGSASGLSPDAAWSVEGNNATAELGSSVASAGDVNGDGYSDVVIGAPYYDADLMNEGRAFVYLGSASGLSATAAWTAEGNQFGASFGNSVASAGDVNGDGYSDIIVGAWVYNTTQTNAGRAYVYLGSASGLAATPAWTADGDQNEGRFGNSVASAGDVNGDGYSDVIVGAYMYDNGETNEGRAYVYLGSSSGPASTPAWIGECNMNGAYFGNCVASAGDVNGDGCADIIVGAYRYYGVQSMEGRAFVYFGSPSGLSPSPSWSMGIGQASAWFGFSVACAGDVNGDGYADVIVGASTYDGGETDEGGAFVYCGSASGPAWSPAWTAEGGQATAAFGVSVASAGDVNGDGYSDVVIGAPWYDNGQADEGRAFVHLGSATGLAATAAWTAEGDQAGAQFGTSVACAGDVNGDGYSDVIVGAPWYDNGQADEGRAFVYHGSASGLGYTAAWTAEQNQAGAFFGLCVASAGDVNGDGYADVVIGAPYHDNGETDEGCAFVYHGSASGLASSPATTVGSGQAGALFGMSVASAGDVNRDGYSDVIAGAPWYDNGEALEGRAFVYLGSPTGLGSTAVWTAESDQAGAQLGKSVASAGDVNGDGYSDVIIGAPDYDNGAVYQGRAYAYLGSASGPAATAAWTATGSQANSQLGLSVAPAGDVNGDGYGDVIVGAPRYDKGLALVYLGSSSGLAAGAAWTVASDQVDSAFGFSVASAGDVNGDGYSDVIAGAYQYDNGETDEGRAFVYYGNGEAGRGLSLVPGQRAGDDTAPLSVGGLSNNPAGIRLVALGRTPYGVGKVRLQWEIKPFSAPFDGTGLGEGASWAGTGITGAALNELIGGQAPNSRYHWRVRLLYSKPPAMPQPAGRWLTLPPQPPGLPLFRTGPAVPLVISGYLVE